MLNITVIGGSGFIGTQLIEILKGNNRVRNYDKVMSTTFPGLTEILDVRDKDSLRKIADDTDVVILLAAEHKDNVSPVSLYYDVNVEGTKNLLEVMDEKNIKNIIFTSSVAVYGLDRDNPGETAEVSPFNHYGKSKWEAEEVLKQWFDRAPENRTLNVIRPTVVFGENNRGNVYNLLKQIKSGRFLMIGKGRNKKSMSYVGNIIQFINYLLVKDLKGYNVFNYADKPDLSTAELVELIYSSMDRKKAPLQIPYVVGYLGGLFFDIMAKISGRTFPVSAVRIKKFCATTQFPADKVAATGFKAPFTLQEGLTKTINSIK